MKSPLLAAVLALGLAPRAGVELRFDPEPDAEVRRELWLTMELDLSEISVSHNGEDYSPPDVPMLHVRSEERQILLDRYVRLEDGRLLELHRTYEELVETEEVESDMEDASEDTEESSELEGETVVFRWDADEEEYVKSFLESEADEELLEELAVDLDLMFALPEDGRELEPGDAWEFDGDEIDEVLQLGGSIVYDGDEETDEDDPAQQLFDEALEDNMEGSLVCTFVEEREVDGRKVAVVRLELEAAGEAESVETDGPAEITQTAALEFDLVGELLWDLAARRLHALLLEGEFSMTMGLFASGEMEGESFELRQEQVFTGEIEAGLRIEGL